MDLALASIASPQTVRVSSASASENPLAPLYSRGGSGASSGASTPSTIAEYDLHPDLCWDTCPTHAEQAMLDYRRAAWHRSSEDLLSWSVTPDMLHDIRICAEMAEAAGDFGRRSAKFSHWTESPELLACVAATKVLCRDMDNGNPHWCVEALATEVFADKLQDDCTTPTFAIAAGPRSAILTAGKIVARRMKEEEGIDFQRFPSVEQAPSWRPVADPEMFFLLVTLTAPRTSTPLIFIENLVPARIWPNHRHRDGFR